MTNFVQIIQTRWKLKKTLKIENFTKWKELKLNVFENLIALQLRNISLNKSIIIQNSTSKNLYHIWTIV